EIIAQAGNTKEENMIVEIDMQRSENVRRWWPFLRDRRIDMYQNIVKRFID
ncbi:MAG: acyltransferase, partial [Bacteroides sp.]|nr:acyltransferase [Bacteroides sp.]